MLKVLILQNLLQEESFAISLKNSLEVSPKTTAISLKFLGIMENKVCFFDFPTWDPIIECDFSSESLYPPWKWATNPTVNLNYIFVFWW